MMTRFDSHYPTPRYGSIALDGYFYRNYPRKEPHSHLYRLHRTVMNDKSSPPAMNRLPVGISIQFGRFTTAVLISLTATNVPFLRDSAPQYSPVRTDTLHMTCSSSPLFAFTSKRLAIQEQLHLIGMIVISPNIHRIPFFPIPMRENMQKPYRRSTRFYTYT